MTDREAMQQAQLEKLEGTLWMLNQQLTRKQAEIDALRERLAQPVQPQWHMAGFSTPPPREWVGLTDEDMVMCESEEDVRFVRAIEAKLKEKNA